MKNAVLAVTLLMLPASSFAVGFRQTGRATSVRRGGARVVAPRVHAVPVSRVGSSRTRGFAAKGAGSHGFSPQGVSHFKHPSKTSSRGFRSDAPSSDSSQTAPAWAVPGALIRTEGLGFKTSPGSGESQHTVDAGGSIDSSRAQALENQQGIFTGPKDKAASGNSGGASGRTGITAESN